jgi:hypothetical protein
LQNPQKDIISPTSTHPLNHPSSQFPKTKDLSSFYELPFVPVRQFDQRKSLEERANHSQIWGASCSNGTQMTHKLYALELGHAMQSSSCVREQSAAVMLYFTDDALCSKMLETFWSLGH